MDIRKKIVKALHEPLQAEFIKLDDDDGISGFVVSPRFKGMPTLDRQELIDTRHLMHCGDSGGRGRFDSQSRRRIEYLFLDS